MVDLFSRTLDQDVNQTKVAVVGAVVSSLSSSATNRAQTPTNQRDEVSVHHHIHHYDYPQEPYSAETPKARRPLKRVQILSPAHSSPRSQQMNSESKPETVSVPDPAERNDKQEVEEKWSKLQNLKMLFENGFIDTKEYEERRRQIVDAMTGTTHGFGEQLGSKGTGSNLLSSLAPKLRKLGVSVIPRPPPDSFSSIQPERAVKHVFDLKARKWRQQRIWVRIDDVAFAKGGLRLCYHLQESDPEEEDGGQQSLLKRASDSDTVRNQDFQTKFEHYRRSSKYQSAEMNIDPNFVVNGKMTIDTLKTLEVRLLTV